MRPRIAVDLSCLEAHPETGVERYARRLAESLPKAAPDLEFILFTRQDGLSSMTTTDAEVVTVSSRLPRALWREAALPRELKRRNVAVLHAPVAAIPLRSSLKRVATIHDVPPIEGPGAEGLVSRNRLRMLHATQAATALIVPSTATRDALVAYCADSAERIRVIPHGVDADFRPEGTGLNRGRYGIPERPYVLWVGTIRQRKDPQVLIAAMSQFLAETDSDLQLVMAGDLRVERETLIEPLVERGFADRLCLPGYVYREDLADLYREAGFMVLPSRLEGFGLCALEAMACGLPVIVSDDPALAELTAEAALRFPTGDATALATAMTRLHADGDLSRQLSEAGLARAARYSWEASAKAHANLFSRVDRAGTDAVIMHVGSARALRFRVR